MSELDKIVDPHTRRALSEQAAEFMEDAIKQQGMFALANPFHDVAVHEAGHALMFAMRGLRIKSVEMSEPSPFRRRRERDAMQKKARKFGFAGNPILLSDEAWKQPHWTGSCHPEGGDEMRILYHPAMSDAEARAYVLDTIAGFVAESLIELQGKQQKPLGSSIDERICGQMIVFQRWGEERGPTVFADIFCEALIRLREYQDVLMELAAALEAAPARGHIQHYLTGHTLDAIMAKVPVWTAEKTAEVLDRRHANDNVATNKAEAA